MKIASTYENGTIFQHFGKTQQFKIYNIEQGAVVSSEVLSTNGQGHGALSGLLKEWGVDTVICGGIGPGARTALVEAGIKLCGGIAGDPDDVVTDLLNGTLVINDKPTCDHHGHEHGTCGHHESGGCGHHHH